MKQNEASPVAAHEAPPQGGMTGQRFGRLTVVGVTAPKGNGRHSKVWCRCDCGKRVAVETRNLTAGRSKTCGCGKADHLNTTNRPRMDMVGRVVGSWTVIAPAGVGRWNCRCVCGGERDVAQSTLVRGDSKSCGCQRKAAVAAARLEKGEAWAKRGPDHVPKRATSVYAARMMAKIF